MKTEKKLVRTIDTDRHITKVYWTLCHYCNATGGPDECTEDKWIGNKFVSVPKPHVVCCLCKGKKGWENREKSQKFLCVGGPLDGTWQIADFGRKISPAKEYILFNRSSQWGSSKDVPSAVLIYASKVNVKI